MVKRKRTGSCSVQEDKQQDDGMTLDSNREKTAKISELRQFAQEPSSSGHPNNLRQRNQHQATKLSSVSNQTQSNSNIQEDNVGSPEKQVSKVTAQRTSNRISKRPRKEATPVVTQPATKKPATKANAPTDQSKTRRTWELWSVEDKNAFFDALCEYGKDFESIQLYIAQRSKKKGVPPNMIKNKDQVRHLYYRTWHKIAKYLDIGDDVKKQAQELYGLINYAELRKKVGGGLNEKNRIKLNELIFNGVTAVKYRGKKLRIKTPVCRALKKLNSTTDTKEPEVQKFPKEVSIEFRPATNAAWLRVQNLAQNPRIRTKLNLQRRLKTVIEYLQKRWQPLRLKQKLQILGSLPSSCVPDLPPDPCPLLRLRPQKDVPISLLSISSIDVASSSDVCLENYLKSFLKDFKEKENIKTKKSYSKSKNKTAECKLNAEQNAKAVSNPCEEKLNKTANVVSEELTAKDDDDKLSQEQNTITGGLLTPPKSVPENPDFVDNPVDEAQRSLSLLTDMLSTMDNEIQQPSPEKSSSDEGTEIKVCNESIQSPLTPECRSIEEFYLTTQNNEDMTLGQLLGLGTAQHTEQVLETKSELCETVSVLQEQSSKNSDEFEKGNLNCKNNFEANGKTEKLPQAVQDEIKRIRNGWTVENIGMLTVGELYLMLECPEKIILEYDWEQPDTNLPDYAADVSEIGKQKQQINNLTEVLRKLIYVATTTFTDIKNKQAPLSPTNRSGCHGRNASTPPSSKSSSSSRGSTRSPSVRAGGRNNNGPASKSGSADKNVNKEAGNVICPAQVFPVASDIVTHTTTVSSVGQTCTVLDVSSSCTDKHVFVRPVGTAPRTIKQPTAESVREQLDVKLMPPARRGGRTRRKPLVVQRPLLLPRDDLGTPRPMTVVHLVPSSSQLSPLTAVIPSGSTTTNSVSKVTLPHTKNLVKIVPTGSPLDMHQIQVPLLKPVNSNVLPAVSLPTTHLVMASTTVSSSLNAIQTRDNTIGSQQGVASKIVVPTIASGSSLLQQIEHNNEQTVLIQSRKETSSPSVSVVNTSCSQVDPLSLGVLTVSKSASIPNICITTSTSSSSPPQISIPENITSGSSPPISPNGMSSFLDMNLEEGSYLQTESLPDHAEHLLDFNENSNSSLSAFGLTSSLPSNKITSTGSQAPAISTCLESDPVRRNTPPHSPPSSRFRISSPGPEGWLNGESADLSLSSLLNTLESPCKAVPASTATNSSDNSNLDPIVRLAPDVDSQLQCLMNESSIDYVAKFADLAAQIASTSDNKPS